MVVVVVAVFVADPVDSASKLLLYSTPPVISNIPLTFIVEDEKYSYSN